MENKIILANIIDSCNYNCRYCYNVFPRNGIALNLDALYCFLNSLQISRCTPVMLNIEGGEPTLHKKLLNFCKQLQTLSNFKTYIYTNFSASTATYKDILSCMSINIVATWHLVDDAHTDDFLHKLQTLQCYKDRIEVVIMYEDINIDKSYDVMTKAKKLVSNINLSYICNTSTYKTTYTSEDNKHYLQLISSSKKEYAFNNIRLSEPELTYYAKDFNFKHCLCEASMQSLYIHNNGLLYYCPSYYLEKKSSIGNIFQKNYKFKNTPIICTCRHCADYLNVKKYKLNEKSLSRNKYSVS